MLSKKEREFANIKKVGLHLLLEFHVFTQSSQFGSYVDYAEFDRRPSSRTVYCSLDADVTISFVVVLNDELPSSFFNKDF